jgi:hypothetical protein
MPLYTNGVGVVYWAAAYVDCREAAGLVLVEKGVVIGEMRDEQQIPLGNERKKSKNKGKALRGLVVSHPCPNGGRGVGHPVLFWGEEKGREGATGVDKG